MSKNRHEFVVLDFAGIIYNFVLIPIPLEINRYMLEYILDLTEVTTIFCDKECLNLLLEIKGKAFINKK